MKDAILGDPISFGLGFLILIPVLLWSVYLAWGMISLDIDMVVGILGLVAATMVGVAAMAPASHRFVGLTFFLAYGSFIVLPIAKYFQGKMEQKDFEVETLEKAYAQLGMQPANSAAKFRIARFLFEHGEVDAAAAIGNAVIDNLSPRHFPDEHRMLRDWRHFMSAEPPTSYTCCRCGAKNRPGDLFCQNCAAPFFLEEFRHGANGPDLSKKVMSVWMAIVLIGLGIPFSWSAFEVPLALAVTVILIAVSVYVPLVAFRPDEVPG